ncbi:unnamed protein product [Urochloa humidicola]
MWQSTAAAGQKQPGEMEPPAPPLQQHQRAAAAVVAARRAGAGEAAVADAAELDAEAPPARPRPRVAAEWLLLARGGGGGGERREQGRDGGAADRAGQAGAESRVDAGGVECVAARREKTQPGVRLERREADDAVRGVKDATAHGVHRWYALRHYSILIQVLAVAASFLQVASSSRVCWCPRRTRRGKNKKISINQSNDYTTKSTILRPPCSNACYG